ncbi:hypothetical protein [Kyrpidia spormannii]|uniref:hypothetical protein n=1 Tax=Kyrpidia spormannii TaxID=2055160 RepID=UPI00147508DA|nr:hypothetical protein [Kyrpidia spormannii]
MKDWKKAEELAAERMQMVSPLLAEGLDAAKAREIRAKLCQQTGLSERTLRRFMARKREVLKSRSRPVKKKRLHCGGCSNSRAFLIPTPSLITCGTT